MAILCPILACSPVSGSLAWMLFIDLIPVPPPFAGGIIYLEGYSPLRLL